MGKILSVIGGTVAIVIAIFLCIACSEALWLGIQFSAIIILFFGGLIALIAGVSEIKDSMASKEEEEKEKKD